MPNFLPNVKYALNFLNSFESERYSYKYVELPSLASTQIGFTIYCEDYWTGNGVGTTSIGFGYTGELLSWNGSEWVPSFYNYNVQIFNTAGSHTWTRPNRISEYNAWFLGGGAGGGSGRKGAAGVVRTGGSAGSASAVHNTGWCQVVSGIFPSATESVVVGAGGIGGTGQSTNSTNGNPGASGGFSSWGWLRVPGGIGGGGGTATTVTGAAAQIGTPRDFYNSTGASNGGVGSASAAIGGVTAPASTSCAPSTAGSGGGISVGNFGQYGGTSGRVGNAVNTTLPAFVNPVAAANTPNNLSANGINGANGIGLLFPFFSGTGGSGGSSADPANTASNGGNGGNGGNWGASGGGGGACTDGTGTSGAGGNGAPGLVIVYSKY